MNYCTDSISLKYALAVFPFSSWTDSNTFVSKTSRRDQMDAAKAYDLINHEKLLTKLKANEVPHRVVNVEYFLSFKKIAYCQLSIWNHI